MKKNDRILLEKILTDTQDIQEFIQGHNRESFINNKLVQNAVVMSLLKIGERAHNLSTEFKSDTTQIPWEQMTRLRHIAAHEYEVLRTADIWVNATRDVSLLQQQLQAILNR